MVSNQACLCGSGEIYSACCEPYITGQQHAPTALALMRSRFSAFATNQIAYITKTQADNLPMPTAEEAKQIQWVGLAILEAKTNQVEFIAYYLAEGTLHQLHERSYFSYENNRWLYIAGKPLPAIKLQRNQRCPCASGKKFKQCCGKH